MKIFVSYRRDDLAAKNLVGRIRERLVKKFGNANVFVDEHAVPPGVDFRDVLRERLKSCDVVFALIGPQWQELLRTREAGSEDHLRFEIEMALESNARVVPILLSGARMPTEAELPESIASFAYLNGRSLDSGPDFDDQLRRLINDLAGPKRTVLPRVLGGSLVLAALAGVVALFTLGRLHEPAVKSVSVLVVMGENVEYEQVMARSFIRHLQKQLSARGVELIERQTIIPRFKNTYASPDSEAGREVWKDVVENIRYSYSAGSIDYFVTLGTFATTAIKKSDLIHYLNPRGLIYLGVTDPKRAGFIGAPKVAGVQYGTGGIAYGKKIAELFPKDQKLVFIYQSGTGNPQDKAIAADLDQLNREYAISDPDARQPRFEVRPIEKLIEISDLHLADYSRPKDSDVYFAWYGLDNILSLENKTSLDNDRLWIIPSTYSPRNFLAAGLIVSVDDTEVGRLGAEIILKHVDNPGLNLAQEPVGQPGFRVWINRDTLKNKRLRLAEDVYDRKDDPSYSFEAGSH